MLLFSPRHAIGDCVLELLFLLRSQVCVSEMPLACVYIVSMPELSEGNLELWPHLKSESLTYANHVCASNVAELNGASPLLFPFSLVLSFIWDSAFAFLHEYTCNSVKFLSPAGLALTSTVLLNCPFYWQCEKWKLWAGRYLFITFVRFGGIS